MSSADHQPNHPTPSPAISPPQTPSRRNRTFQTSRAPPETPRRRRDNHQQRLQGVKSNLPANLSLQSIRRRLITSFDLPYTPDDWQVHIIRRILQGYDSIFCAGTGYGKSLVFEALAVLGGPGKLVLVISPLKALERDQAEQAVEKGIDAIVINEDTTKSTALWKSARTSSAMVYMSPEMVLSESFLKLWKDSRFRTRLTVIVVDEAHCVDEWGGEDFRPQYRQLERLRIFTGQEVPIVSCTATATSSTFDIIWKTIGYGSRPFWGLDVGCDRPNLFYITRPIVNTMNPLLDILFILPQVLDSTTLLDAIAKCLLYFDSESACRRAVQFIRKCLPPHLRSCVQAFSSNMSEAAKKRCWQLFQSGEIRIICATDAAGMGCNIPNVKYVISFGIPKSVGTVVQRWGRAGRDRTTQGVCLLLVPKWAFRPEQSAIAAHAQQRLQRGGQKAPETKTDALKRARLDAKIETFINIGSDNPPVCVHQFVEKNFSPETSLAMHTTLAENRPVKTGSRSAAASFEMSWTVLNLHRTPPRDRCCYICNPTIALSYASSDIHDPRLRTFAADFLQPIVPVAPSRPSSSMSTRTNDSQLSTFAAVKGAVKVSSTQKEILRHSLMAFRRQLWEEHGSPSFFSSQMFLPPKQLESFLQHCPKYLSTQSITTSFLQKLVKWDSACEADIEKVVSIISDWRESIQPSITPTSQRRVRKKTRAQESPDRTPRQSGPPPSPVRQPVFTPMPPRPRPQPRPIAKPSMSNTSDVFRGTQMSRPADFYSPTPTAPVSSPPIIHNPYPYEFYHTPPPLTTLPRNSLSFNPYRHHLTTPGPYSPAAYPYPPLVPFPPTIIYQTPVVPHGTHSPASPVENSPPPPRDPNPFSSSSA